MEEANPKVEQRYPFQPPQAWAAPIPKRRRLSGPAVIGIAVGGVVAMMVVVFVLAAIAIPVFLNQRAKAQMAELGDPWSQVVASEGAWAQSYQDLAAVSASESSTFEDVVAAVAEYETALSLFEGKLCRVHRRREFHRLPRSVATGRALRSGLRQGHRLRCGGPGGGSGASRHADRVHEGLRRVLGR